MAEPRISDTTARLPSVLLLAGGPDDEHPVSLDSAAGIEAALRQAGAEVHKAVIDRPTPNELRAMPGDVVFPALHGSFGEGGPLQDTLVALGRPFVGSGPRAARAAMDKLGTKLRAATLGIATKPACVFNPRDTECPIDPPVVLKPVHDGSSVGLYLCESDQAWRTAHAEASRDIAARPGRAYMVEPLVRGRELTVGLIQRDSGDFEPLPIIEIAPASGVYDYQAKYDRDDTRYDLDPDLPPGVAQTCREHAARLADAIGVRHLCRVDYLLDADARPWLLELNTMPGFTTHSLLPMAARASGLEMPDLCAGLVRAAMQGRGSIQPIT